MFWTQCDKIVTSGGPVKCDFCPCPKYIYVTRCDKTENDFDDCDCNPENAWERARLVTYFASQNGCINMDGAWRRLNHTYYPADGSEFSANGSIYKAIETGENGPKTYDTRQKAQTEWDAHPKSYWGEKVIAACTCCCIGTIEADVTVTTETSASTTYYEPQGDVVMSYSNSGTYKSRTPIHAGSNSLSVLTGGQISAIIHEVVYGKVTHEECEKQFSADEDNPTPSFTLELDEHCQEWTITSGSSPYWMCIYGEPTIYYWGTHIDPYKYKIDNMTSTKVKKSGLYPYGIWTYSGEYSADGESMGNPTYTHNTFKMTVSITEVGVTHPIPAAYETAFNELGEDLR